MKGFVSSSNNTNKLSPQERGEFDTTEGNSSNNTNKLSPQEPARTKSLTALGSNNTNKLSPQELGRYNCHNFLVQIIQINLVLKN